MKNKILYIKYDKLDNIINELKEKQNTLEQKIKIKIEELEKLKETYLYYLLENDKDNYAKENYNKYKNQIELLKELIEGN